MIGKVLIVAGVFFFSGAGVSGEIPTTALDRLARLSAERVLLADQVAVSKRASGKPVEDAAREEGQLAHLVGNARDQALDPQAARRFFEAQMEANKLVQYQLLSHGAADGSGIARVDLADVRARLDRINAGMLRELAPALAQASTVTCDRQLARTLDNATREMHLDALHAIALTRSFGDFCRWKQ